MGCGTSRLLGGTRSPKAATPPTAKMESAAVIGGDLAQETRPVSQSAERDAKAAQNIRRSPTPSQNVMSPPVAVEARMLPVKPVEPEVQPQKEEVKNDAVQVLSDPVENRKDSNDADILLEQSVEQVTDQPAIPTAKETTHSPAPQTNQNADIDDLEWAELKEEKLNTVHIQFINEDGTDMFCSFDSATNFWQIASKIRSAYGEQICFLSPKSLEPISSLNQFSALMEGYKSSKDKHMVIHTRIIPEPDLDDIDEFEDIYEDKKTQVFIRYFVDNEDPIDCTFPLPFSFFQLKDQFRGGKEGSMYVSAQYGKKDEIFIRDESHFQQILSEYQTSFYKYLHMKISHHVLKDVDDEDEQLLLDKQIEIQVLCIVDDTQYEIRLPRKTTYEEFIFNIRALLKGSFKVFSFDENELPQVLVDNNAIFSQIVESFSKTYERQLRFVISRVH